MTDTSFVRTEMLPEKAPPPSSVGLVGWIRANLFSSWFNSILTLVALYFLVTLLMGLLPWIFQSETRFDSLKNCREVFFINYGTSHGHACWSVISERWLQLIYGFYPSDAYWRPNLAFILLLVALAPILFSEYVPRQLLWVTAAYPFILPYLMWGGAIWVPILVALGLVVGYVIYRVLEPVGGTLLGIPVGALAAILWWLFAISPLTETINRMVAGPSLDRQVVTLGERVDELTPQVAEMDTELRALNKEILAGEKEREKLFAVLEEIEDAEMEAGKTKGQVRDLPQFQEAADVFLTHLTALSALKEQARILSRDKSGLDTELSAARILKGQIEALPANEAALPGLRAAFDAAQDAMPASLRGVRSVEEIQVKEIEATPEELDRFDDFLKARSELSGVENQISRTYAEAGRIGLKPVESRNFGGFMLSIMIGVVAIGASLPIGIVLALGRQSDLLIVKAICVGFIEFIRGVPLITLLFVANSLLNIFMPPGTSFDIILRVMIMVTLFASAYMAEVIRGGLAALPKGQYEGGDSLGLNYWQSQRLIIMPQALKISIPGIVSNFIGIFKDTTLVSIIGLLDPLGLSQGIRSNAAWNGIYWELFAFIALLFFVFCFGMSRYSMYLEKKLQTDHR